VPIGFIEHLTKSIFFEHSKHCYVAIFTAYFDASGKPTSTVLCFGGFVSRPEKWDKFEREWKDIISQEGVSYFHMTDFASSEDEFKGWRGQSQRRRIFMDALVQCLNRRTNKGFCTSVIAKEYNELNQTYMLHEFIGDAYTFAGASCIGALKTWAIKKNVPVGNILVLVEEGDERQGRLINTIRKEGFKAATQPKMEAHAFAGGDLVAWKNRTGLHNAAFGKVETVEDAENIMRSLDTIRGIVHRNGAYGKDELTVLCERAKIPKRSTIKLP